MKILYVLSSAGIGGVEKLACRLAASLKDKHHISVVIPSTDTASQPLRFFMEKNFHSVYCLPILQPNGYDFIRDIVRDYDVVHVFNFCAIGDSAIKDGAKVVQSIFFHPDAMPPSYSTILSDNMDKYHALTVDSRLHLPSLPKAIYIPNFVDTNLYSKSGGDNVIWVGKFNSTKRPDILIDIINKSDRNFIIVDGNPQIPGSDIYRKTLSANKRVVLCQKASDSSMLDFYKNSTHILFTSDFEGTPVSLLEAMSCGIIPVCRPVGNITNIINDDVNGFTYESPDDAVKYLNIHSRTISCNARQSILDNHSADMNIALYDKIYTEGSGYCG